VVKVKRVRVCVISAIDTAPFDLYCTNSLAPDLTIVTTLLVHGFSMERPPAAGIVGIGRLPAPSTISHGFIVIGTIAPLRFFYLFRVL